MTSLKNRLKAQALSSTSDRPLHHLSLSALPRQNPQKIHSGTPDPAHTREQRYQMPPLLEDTAMRELATSAGKFLFFFPLQRLYSTSMYNMADCPHRRRKIRCSKAAAENEGDQDAPCENCSKAGISCTFAHAVEAQKPVKHDWSDFVFWSRKELALMLISRCRQPPKTTSSIHRKQTRHHHPSRPATSCTMSRPATSSALYSSIPPHSAGSLGGYSLAFTPSSDSGSRLSGTAASSLSFLSSPSHHSSSSSLFAYAPPLEPAWRMANISNVLASTSLQKTFLTFSRESATSDAAPLHAGAASVQSPMGCALDVAAQAIGTAMIGSAQSIKADSDALLLFYYDHFRQGRVGTELLMATCLKVGRLPPSLERDRRALSLSLIAAWCAIHIV